MTDKVIFENPTYIQQEIENSIKVVFNNQKLTIVWLPWKNSDTCGHTDGILHYIGTAESGRPIVLTNLSLYTPNHAEEMKTILKAHFDIIELNLSVYDEMSWAYINMLQMRDVIIVPGIGNPVSDKEALAQIKSLYPEFKDKIYQVQMKDLIAKWDGALNCCTWTISNEISYVPHNLDNNLKYNELVAKAKNNKNAITEDELFFLRDYYPLKLESISYQLDKLYWSF